MTVTATSADQALLPVGGVWVLRVSVLDWDGSPADQAPVFTVTDPTGGTSTPVVETVATGDYRATYTIAAAGRHVARAATAVYGVADFAAFAADATTGAGMPVVADVATYLRENAASWDTADLQDALDAEAAAQRAVCRVRAVYPDDLRQALLRRTQRNLAMRQLPLAVLQGDAEGGGLVLPGSDPEVRRLEGPHRKLVFG